MNNKPNSSLRDLLVGGDYRLDTNEGLGRTVAAIEQYIKSLVPEKKVDEQNIIGTIYGYDVRGEAIKGSYWAGYNAAIDKILSRLESNHDTTK